MVKGCIRRIQSEITQLFADPLPGICVFPSPDNIQRVDAVILGPERTPYAGGFFHFEITIPDDYPFEAPRVQIKTTDGGTVGFNPNLYASGKVCLSILGTYSGPPWSPLQTMSSLLLSIQSLLSDEPLRNEPGFERSPKADVDAYNHIIRYHVLRVAVSKFILDLTDSSRLWAFSPWIRGVFKHHASFYERAIDEEEAWLKSAIAKSAENPSDHSGFLRPSGDGGFFCHNRLVSMVSSSVRFDHPAVRTLLKQAIDAVDALPVEPFEEVCFGVTNSWDHSTQNLAALGDVQAHVREQGDEDDDGASIFMSDGDVWAEADFGEPEDSDMDLDGADLDGADSNEYVSTGCSKTDPAQRARSGSNKVDDGKACSPSDR